MLDRRADSGGFRIGLGDVLGQRSTRHAPLNDVGLEHAALEERLVLLAAIGGVSPTGVSLADELGTRNNYGFGEVIGLGAA